MAPPSKRQLHSKRVYRQRGQQPRTPLQSLDPNARVARVARSPEQQRKSLFRDTNTRSEEQIVRALEDNVGDERCTAGESLGKQEPCTPQRQFVQKMQTQPMGEPAPADAEGPNSRLLDIFDTQNNALLQIVNTNASALTILQQLSTQTSTLLQQCSQSAPAQPTGAHQTARSSAETSPSTLLQQLDLSTDSPQVHAQHASPSRPVRGARSSSLLHVSNKHAVPQQRVATPSPPSTPTRRRRSETPRTFRRSVVRARETRGSSPTRRRRPGPGRWLAPSAQNRQSSSTYRGVQGDSSITRVVPSSQTSLEWESDSTPTRNETCDAPSALLGDNLPPLDRVSPDADVQGEAPPESAAAGPPGTDSDWLPSAASGAVASDPSDNEEDVAEPEADVLQEVAADIDPYYNDSHASRRRRWKPQADAARLPLQTDVFDYRHILGRPTHACRHCGALHWMEEKTHASPKREPQFSCCSHGSVRVAEPGPYPDELKALLFGYEPAPRGDLRLTEESRHFQKHIRGYNSAFAFCSTRANVDPRVAAFTFCVKGQLFHHMGSLDPPAGKPPSFAQIYILDGDEAQMAAREQVSNRSGQLRPAIMRRIHSLLHQINPFIRSFRTAAQRIREDRSVTIRIGIVEAAHTDPRTYNLPQTQEVAALIPVSAEQEQAKRHIIIQRMGGALQLISDYANTYLPLRYPIMRPRGELGWTYRFLRHGFAFQPDMAAEEDDERRDGDPDVDGDGIAGLSQEPRRGRHGSDKVTQQEWWHYTIQMREPLSPLMYAGRLFHEMVVDAFASIEGARLHYYKIHQGNLRAARAQGLMDAAAQDGFQPADLGTRVILPATHTGSPRQMQNAYYDAMALTRKFGAPDFFITFTCNPGWPEIQRELKPGQTTRDRPDVVNRVFNLKLKQMQEELTKKSVLGRIAVLCWTIEFQKRGLPHAHMLLIMEPGDRPRTVEDIDAAIRADIPDKQTEPLLHAVVTRFMLHSPCGERNPKSSCMRGGHCRFKFPKAFQEETAMVSGRPIYRRPANGPTHVKGKARTVYTSRDVAPYNAYLSVRFNAHINVESCQGYGGVKYVYKYIYKGQDRATVCVAGKKLAQPGEAPEPVDEIREYLDARYISTHEALWRIATFKTHGRTVGVQRLAIHLENAQQVIFNADILDMEQVDERARRPSTLMAFFAENAKTETGSGHFYHDFPLHYTWSMATRAWSPRRKGGFCVGRITWIPPSAGEAYYLRLLLVNVPNQRSFEDARTVNGSVCPTYKEARRLRGLLNDDQEWKQTLEEAAISHTGYMLRKLFITILTQCSPSDPLALWEQVKDKLADDCEHIARERFGIDSPTEEDVVDLCLFLLLETFLHVDKDRETWPLPLPQRDWVRRRHASGNSFISEQLDHNIPELIAQVTQWAPCMNAEQRQVHTALTAAVDAGAGGLYFIDGPGGTGKTFLQNLTLAHVRSQGKIALAVASTGIAATLLTGGTTAHSRFKIPLDPDADSICSVAKESDLAEMFRRTELIFWDEAVMFHRWGVEAVSRLLQDVRESELPFGGIVTCFSGDFRQTLPIVKRGMRGQIVSATVKRSPLWQNVHTFKLTQNMRLEREGLSATERASIKAFSERLLRVGESTGPDECVGWPRADLAADGEMSTVDALTRSIFPDLASRLPSTEHLRKHAILAARNDMVKEINAKLLDTMPGDKVTLLSSDASRAGDGAMYPEEFLHSLDAPELPPHRLELKKGTPVIMLRNLNPKDRLCNGTRLQVERVSRRCLLCRILGTTRHGELELIPRIPLPSSRSLDIEFTRRQYPIKVAFAITINKSQGQSFDKVGVVLDPPVFSHGQLYVALSRVTNPEGVCLYVPHESATRAADEVRIKNVVYQEVLTA